MNDRTKKSPLGSGAEYLKVFQKFHSNNTSSNRRKLPPYGARLRNILADPVSRSECIGTSPDGSRLTAWVLIGADAWTQAGSWSESPRKRAFVLLPPGDDPTQYNWELLRGHDPILLEHCGDVDGEQAKTLVVALMRDGVRRVLHTHTGLRYVAEVAHD